MGLALHVRVRRASTSRPRTVGCVSPASLPLAGARPRRLELLLKEIGSLVSRMGVANRGDSTAASAEGRGPTAR